MESPKEHLQLSDFTEFPLTLFKLGGITFFKSHPEEKQPFREKLALVVFLVNMIPQFVFKHSFLYFGTFSSPIEMTAYVCYVGFVYNSLCKMLCIYHGRFILHHALIEMDRLFPKTDRECVEHNVRENYVKIKFNTKALVIYHFVTTTMFNFFPLVQSIFEYFIYGVDFVPRFPFIISYPFDDTHPAVYPFVYFYQVHSAYILSCFFLGADILLVTTVHVICMYFEFLAKKIENFEPTGTDEDLKELKGFIQYHRNILGLSHNINEVFSVAILLNYFASGGVICMIGFQITVGSEILDLFKFFAFLISSLVHVYFICSFGTNLMTMSSNISEAVYCHKWYLGNNKYKKMLILLLARAQKPAFLTAFKFFEVSMESFKSLMSTSYQFFTLIKTQYDEEA